MGRRALEAPGFWDANGANAIGVSYRSSSRSLQKRTLRVDRRFEKIIRFSVKREIAVSMPTVGFAFNSRHSRPKVFKTAPETTSSRLGRPRVLGTRRTRIW